jgi:hypothetical protein
MKLKSFFLMPALMLALVAPAGTAFGDIITFDDLPYPVAGIPVITNGYANLQWNNFNYLNGTTIVPSGYENAVVSANNVAFNNNGNPAQISGGEFNLISAYLTGAWNDGLSVQVQGFLSGNLAYDRTYTVNTTGPTLINFDFVGVDQVVFSSSGGTPNPAYAGHGLGAQFAMDNLDIILVPEPSTLALIGLGTAMLLGFRRNRRLA